MNYDPYPMPTTDEDVKMLVNFDRRTVQRNIKRQVVGAKDYEKYLKALPDVASNIAPPETRVEQRPAPAPRPAAPLPGTPVSVDAMAAFGANRAAARPSFVRSVGGGDGLPGQPVDPAEVLGGADDKDDE